MTLLLLKLVTDTFRTSSSTGSCLEASVRHVYMSAQAPDLKDSVVAKLVDGSAYNQHFWVYYGALSNVEYTLTVTDTVAGGPPKIYRNALGQFGSFGDIEAFPAP